MKDPRNQDNQSDESDESSSDSLEIQGMSDFEPMSYGFNKSACDGAMPSDGFANEDSETIEEDADE